VFTRTWRTIFNVNYTVVYYYGAMLFIAVTMLLQDVCPSVRLFVHLSVCHTPVFCRNGKRFPQTFFTIGKPHHSSFSLPNGRYSNILTGTPNGGVKCRGYEKIAIVNQYPAVSRKWYKIETLLLWNANRKPYTLHKLSNVSVSSDLKALYKSVIIIIIIMVSVSMTLWDPQPRSQGHAIIWRRMSQKWYETACRQSYNGILRPTPGCRFKWPWVT